MRSWQEDLLSVALDGQSEHEVFTKLEAAAANLGFEHVAYGFRSPLPLSNPRTILLNNYPAAWRERYVQAGYLHSDPTVAHGRKSQKPIVWTDCLFRNTPSLWEEARSFGLKFGWAQSSLDSLGAGGMLTLSRSHDALSAQEMSAKQQQMRWLVHIAHLGLARFLKNSLPEYMDRGLTCREVEILKWTADGKSAQDIADILTVSKNTVEFHVKNAVAKLSVANKTAAVVRAAMLGYLS